MLERREKKRLCAICQVLDLERNWVGVSFDLTTEGVHVALSSAFAPRGEFSVILRRGETEQAPEVIITICPVWYHGGNNLYQEIGGKIVAVENEKEFQAFLDDCQEAALCGVSELK
ncbi:MAG: hypothetical protein ACRDEA_21505 [Microcystaceae cyanobacterium]